MKFLHFLARKSIDRKCLTPRLSEQVSQTTCVPWQTTQHEVIVREAKTCHDHDLEKSKKKIFKRTKTLKEKVACLFHF